MNSLPSKPLITTIIPTYQRPKLLQRAIHSVLNQTYPKFQVRVYDNASGDETAAVVTDLTKQDPRVKYHCHPQNMGAIQNFNYGMKQVTTPYFSLLSDDNTLLPHFFEDAINMLNRNQKAILYAGQTIRVNERGQKIAGSLDRWSPGLVFPPNGLLHIMEKGVPNWESVLFRTEVINSVGLLNPYFYGSVDQDFMMRIAGKHIFYISKTPHALFLCHNNSWTVNRDLNEVISTLRKRMEQWFQNEELSKNLKGRLKRASDAKVKNAIYRHVYRKCIIGKDTAAIATAMELMKKELGLSFKPLAAIVVAKVANYNRFLKGLVSTSVHWYLQPKITIRNFLRTIKVSNRYK